MKKTVGLVGLVVALALVGTACGGGSGGSDAKSKFTSYISKYGSTINEIGSAFGKDGATNITFEEYTSSLEASDCTAISGDDIGGMALLIGPELQSHGLSVVGFVKDTNDLYKALHEGGFC